MSAERTHSISVTLGIWLAVPSSQGHNDNFHSKRATWLELGEGCKLISPSLAYRQGRRMLYHGHVVLGVACVSACQTFAVVAVCSASASRLLP